MPGIFNPNDFAKEIRSFWRHRNAMLKQECLLRRTTGRKQMNAAAHARLLILHGRDAVGQGPMGFAVRRNQLPHAVVSAVQSRAHKDFVYHVRAADLAAKRQSRSIGDFPVSAVTNEPYICGRTMCPGAEDVGCGAIRRWRRNPHP